MQERPGGPAIPESSADRARSHASHGSRGSRAEGARPERFDLERLERAVSELTAAYRHLRTENAGLRRELELRGQRIRALDGRLLEANQKRQDVAKRIDELIAQIDQLEASFESVDA